jgi:hypothetical protein
MASDERIKANEWEVKKRCPICADIAAKKLDLEGEQLFDDANKTQPMFCPGCGHLDIRMFHEVGAVEIARTSQRGDTQPWTHIVVVKCMSCEWSHTAATNPCLGNPWDEVMGFDRPMDQTTETKRKVRFSNEQAVGLRAHDEKYTRKTRLRDKRYKAQRNVHQPEPGSEESQSEESTFTYVPTKEEERLPRFKKNKDKPEE